jgi:hypothetical protein
MTNEERERAIVEALGGLARAARDSPAAKTEEVLLAAFRARRPRRRISWPAWIGAAAALILAVYAIWNRPALKADRVQQEVATEFIPLHRGPVLLPAEGSQIIRIALPRREMRRFGIPVRADLDESKVQAEVLVGQDGMARAVRFIH